MLSCAVKRCRRWLCRESLGDFFCYPCSLCFPLLDVTKITQLCPKLNIPTERPVVPTPTYPPQTTPSRRLFARDQKKLDDALTNSLGKWVNLFIWCWRVLTFQKWRSVPHQLMMKAVKRTHELFFSVLIHLVRPCPKGGAVNYAVSVRALKSTITEDLDWII